MIFWGHIHSDYDLSPIFDFYEARYDIPDRAFMVLVDRLNTYLADELFACYFPGEIQPAEVAVKFECFSAEHFPIFRFSHGLMRDWLHVAELTSIATEDTDERVHGVLIGHNGVMQVEQVEIPGLIDENIKESALPLRTAT